MELNTGEEKVKARTRVLSQSPGDVFPTMSTETLLPGGPRLLPFPGSRSSVPTYRGLASLPAREALPWDQTHPVLITTPGRREER